MKTIRAKTSVNERHNTHYYTTFDIEYEKPEVDEEFSPINGTKIAEVFPVCADLHHNNTYTPDGENFFELWGVKILTDEEDETCVEYQYIAVPVEVETEPEENEEGDDE